MRKSNLTLSIATTLVIVFLFTICMPIFAESKQVPDVKRMPNPTVVPPQVVHRTQMLPDLVASRAQISTGCNLVITVTNRSKGAITADQHSRLVIKVQWRPAIDRTGRPPRSARISMSTLDPRHQLRRSGGSVTYDTGIRLIGDQYVTFRVDDRNQVRELSERNNTFSDNLLAPANCR